MTVRCFIYLWRFFSTCLIVVLDVHAVCVDKDGEEDGALERAVHERLQVPLQDAHARA